MLLGPEGTGAHTGFRLSSEGGWGCGGLLSLTVGRLLPAAHLLWCVARGWSVGCLRTVQWTRASLIFCGQVIKSIRWMPWH